jgi:2-methylcitrate dehydratase PrpD
MGRHRDQAARVTSMAANATDGDRAERPLALRIAAALHAFGPADLDAALIAKAKLCIIDYLSSAFAAGPLPWSEQAVALAAAQARSGNGPATIVGAADGAPAHDAAFANAVLGHGLVRDDMHLPSISHLGVVVLPPLFALAELRDVSGRQLLAAIVAGYEAGGKLGRMILDVDVARIFRPTGITGAFAGAAAGAKLLGLTPERYAAALAIAANCAAGYNEWAATGGTEMFFQPGFAARNAVTAVELAAAGAYGSPTALDGAAGMLAAFGKLPARNVPLPFADRPEILAVFSKEVPACNFAQAAAQAARDVASSEVFDAAEIERVDVRVTAAAAAYPGCDCAGPFEHILQAKMSIHYNVAAALVTGNFDERNYLPGEQPAITALAAAVELCVDDALTQAYPGKQGAEVVVRMRDGRTLRRRNDDVAPASDDAVRARFEAAGSLQLGAAATERLAAFVDGLENEPAAGALPRLCRARGAA